MLPIRAVGPVRHGDARSIAAPASRNSKRGEAVFESHLGRDLELEPLEAGRAEDIEAGQHPDREADLAGFPAR